MASKRSRLLFEVLHSYGLSETEGDIAGELKKEKVWLLLEVWEQAKEFESTAALTTELQTEEAFGQPVSPQTDPKETERSKKNTAARTMPPKTEKANAKNGRKNVPPHWQTINRAPNKKRRWRHKPKAQKALLPPGTCKPAAIRNLLLLQAATDRCQARRQKRI